MNDGLNEFMQKVASESERRSQTLDKLLSSADSSKVFSEPVTLGAYTVITASEVASGGGFGSGMGFGVPRGRRDAARGEAGAPEDAAAGAQEGAGGGGGGGGGSMGRPVAAIVVGPEGVEVRPLLDVTKISLAALTAFGAMAALTLRMLAKR